MIALFSTHPLVDSMLFRNSKNFMGENAMEGLDELARVTVSNDNEPQDDVRIYWFLYVIYKFCTCRQRLAIHQILERLGMLNMLYEGLLFKVPSKTNSRIFSL